MSERSGSHDVLLTARKYFAHALELKPGCLRALYGIVLVCAALGASTKGKGTKVTLALIRALTRAPTLATKADGTRGDPTDLLAFIEPHSQQPSPSPSPPHAHPHPGRHRGTLGLHPATACQGVHAERGPAAPDEKAGDGDAEDPRQQCG